MPHHPSLATRLSDSAWAYGIGLGNVSAPVIFWTITFYGEADMNGVHWFILVFGTLGMTFGGMAIYSATGRPRRQLERALILTMATPFFALLIASTPFIVFYGIGFFVALVLGFFLMPWAIVVTACWSAFYLARPAPGRRPIYILDESAGPRSVGIQISGVFVLLLSLGIVFWISGGSSLFLNPPSNPNLPIWMGPR